MRSSGCALFLDMLLLQQNKIINAVDVKSSSQNVNRHPTPSNKKFCRAQPKTTVTVDANRLGTTAATMSIFLMTPLEAKSVITSTEWARRSLDTAVLRLAQKRVGY